MQIELFQKTNTYKDKNGVDKTAINFSLLCGNELIPIEVRYFENAEGHDPQYQSRKSVLRAFAAPLPPKSKDNV